MKDSSVVVKPLTNGKIHREGLPRPILNEDHSSGEGLKVCKLRKEELVEFDVISKTLVGAIQFAKLVRH